MNLFKTNRPAADAKVWLDAQNAKEWKRQQEAKERLEKLKKQAKATVDEERRS